MKHQFVTLLTGSLLLLSCGTHPTTEPKPEIKPQKPTKKEQKEPEKKEQSNISEEMLQFFRSHLAGTKANLPQGVLTAQQLDQAEQEVWNIWKEANSSDIRQYLPNKTTLQISSKSSKWVLPDEFDGGNRYPAVLPFYWGYKGAKPNEGFPLFVYMHGSGAKDQEWTTGLQLASSFQDGPSLYFIPQIPNEGRLYRWWQSSKQFAWERLFRLSLASGEVDPHRIYIFGISEGAYGSQRLASYYADYLAGAGPMAGGEPLPNAPVENCEHIAFSLRTGANDLDFYRKQFTQKAKEAFDKLEQMHPGKFKHRIEIIPGRGHGIDYFPTTPWLRQYARTAQPKTVHWEDYPVDNQYRKGFYNLEPLKRPANQTERCYYEEEIKGQTIDLRIRIPKYHTTEATEMWSLPLSFTRSYTEATGGKIRLYLSRQLVNLDQEITVRLNGKEVYRGVLQPNYSALASSCALFGDPLRLFSAMLELSY